MKKQIVKDGKERYLIVSECDSLEQTASGVFYDNELTEELDRLGLRVNPEYYPAQNDNGNWHAFYYLDRIA